jgi:hypothetical protein
MGFKPGADFLSTLKAHRRRSSPTAIARGAEVSRAVSVVTFAREKRDRRKSLARRE